MRRLLSIGAVALLLLGIATYVRYRIDLETLSLRVAVDAKTLRLATGALEYFELGEGDPVLAIHGSGGGFDQALEMTGPLARRHRLIAPSRFGYLGSDFPPSASPELQADAFAEMLDRLGIAQTVIFGGSAGALSAMQLAIRHPERCRGLILFVPAAYAPDRAPNTTPAGGELAQAFIRTILSWDFPFWLAASIMPDTMTRLLLATEPVVVAAQNAAERTRIRQVLWHILPISRRARGLLLDMSTAGAPPPYALDRIRCPVLAISAKDDLYGTAAAARYTAAAVPDGRVLLFETGGHLLAGRDGEVWPAIEAFIEALP